MDHFPPIYDMPGNFLNFLILSLLCYAGAAGPHSPPPPAQQAGKSSLLHHLSKPGFYLHLYGPSDVAAWEMQRLWLVLLYPHCISFGSHMLSDLSKSKTMKDANSPQRGMTKSLKRDLCVQVLLQLDSCTSMGHIKEPTTVGCRLLGHMKWQRWHSFQVHYTCGVDLNCGCGNDALVQHAKTQKQISVQWSIIQWNMT